MPNIALMSSKWSRRTVRAGAVASLLLGAGSIGVGPAGAQATCGGTSASPSLTATPNVASPAGATTITVTGTNYLVPPHQQGRSLFGGIYLFFGWVAPGGQWGPSWRATATAANPWVGQFGATYSYPGEGGGGETRDDGTGTIRLIAFTGGGMSGLETAFTMDCGGNWQTSLVVRGATFQWSDLATGASNTVDCRVVQCGVFTIGAHGIASRTNEQFTPIAIGDGSGAPAPPATASGGGNGDGTPATTAPRPSTSARPRTPTTARPGATIPGIPPTTSTTPAAPADTVPPDAAAIDTVPEAGATTVEVATSTTAPTRRRDRVETTAQILDDDHGGSPVGLVAGAAGAALTVAAAAGSVLVRRRRAGGRWQCDEQGA